MADLDAVVEILRCPVGGGPLRREGDALLSDAGACYAIREGIVDLVAESAAGTHARIEGAYDKAGPTSYDLILGFPGYLKLAWGGSMRDLPDPADILAAMPPGPIADLPVGTGLFTADAVARNPDRTVLAIDYSMGMLRKARARLEAKGATNAILVRADVAQLPFADGSLAGFLSLLGLHAFPHPEDAAREMVRVLQPGGDLAATVCCLGERYLSDFLIERFMVPQHYFGPGRPTAAFRAMLEDAGLGHVHTRAKGALVLLEGKKPAAA